MVRSFLFEGNNMILCGYLRVTFLCLAGIFFLFTLFFEIWQKKWKRLALDIFVYLVQMPLWVILGVAILGIFPELIYSYFSGIWLIVGLLLWLVPHGILAVKAFRRKDYFDLAYSLSGILTIISFCVFIYVWNLTNNVS